MPAVSKAERRVIAIGEHHPDELYPENRGILGMTHQQMHDFASTKETDLPEHVKDSGRVEKAKKLRAEKQKPAVQPLPKLAKV